MFASTYQYILRTQNFLIFFNEKWARIFLFVGSPLSPSAPFIVHPVDFVVLAQISEVCSEARGGVINDDD